MHVRVCTQADWLDKKNTIFGKIVGDTVYNLLRFNEVVVSAAQHAWEPTQELQRGGDRMCLH